MLRLTLWNVLYDMVLTLKLTEEAMMVDFADDLVLTVPPDDENPLACHTLILNLVPHKTEAPIIEGRSNREHIKLCLCGVVMVPVKTLNYLGVTFDERGTFGKYIARVNDQVEYHTVRLFILVLNIGGSSSGKKAILSDIVMNFVMSMI